MYHVVPHPRWVNWTKPNWLHNLAPSTCMTVFISKPSSLHTCYTHCYFSSSLIQPIFWDRLFVVLGKEHHLVHPPTLLPHVLSASKESPPPINWKATTHHRYLSEPSSCKGKYVLPNNVYFKVRVSKILHHHQHTSQSRNASKFGYLMLRP